MPLCTLLLFGVLCRSPTAANYCPRTSGEVKAATFGSDSYLKHDRPTLATRAPGTEAPPEHVYVALTLLSLVEVCQSAAQ